MPKRGLWLVLCILSLVPLPLLAQARTVTGRVGDAEGRPLVGVRVEEKGTLNGVLTGPEGRYSIRVAGSDAVLRFHLFGYREEERPLGGATTLDVTLTQGIELEEVVVVGSRRAATRSTLDTPSPIDIIPVAEVATSAGQLDLHQLLQYVAPAFNATRQSGADGADHIDPASLRGLGPDQTLVLINGKRRHQSSLINIFGSRGRGNTGTDLNAIPASAIERVEILRDGASAQYGSDAIAGVINIVLKSTTGETTGSLATGVHDASPPAAFDVLRDESYDGTQYRAGLNDGIALPRDGFLNLTAEVLSKDHTNRPADPSRWDIYRRQFGDAALLNLGGFANARLPLSGRAALYAFGGVNLRDSDAYAWTREADSERNVPEIYPQGFDPIIGSDIADASLSAGLVTSLAGWDVDLNNTFGSNRFDYFIHNTLNASLGASSPTEFDAGGFRFSQNTTGATASRFFPQAFEGVNVAFGAEFRVDRYEIFAGEEGSWRNFDPDGDRPGGAQGFPGFRPENELNETRSNLGAFVDTEVDLTERLMLGAAARYENYSDFGSTLTGKLSARVRATDALTLRGSVSTGFRAPSLAQIHFNSTFTDFVGGVATDKVIAGNGSELARALGIPALREETATNASAGFTLQAGAFSATVDGYWVDVRDRIVLTGAFEDTDPDIGDALRALDVSAAQFFTNALDTETRGVDVVLAFTEQAGPHRVRAMLAGNFNDMELGDIHTSPQLSGKEDIYFGRREQYFLLASAPPSKLTAGVDHGYGLVDTSVRLNRFGRVELIDWLDTVDRYDPRTTVDVSLSYRVARNASVTLGGSNIFNVYPSQQDTETETGGLWDAVQMGSSGAFYFAKLNFRL